MEQIDKRNGVIYYGNQVCKDADDAYVRFRDDYHASLGRVAYLRLDRIGQRKERVHGFGFVFDPPFQDAPDEFRGLGRVRCRILGFLGIAYSRIVGAWDLPEFTDEQQYERWLDWAFSKGSGALRTVGRRNKSGRTSKRLKTRYR